MCLAQHYLPLDQIRETLAVRRIRQRGGKDIVAPALRDASEEVVFRPEVVIDLQIIAIGIDDLLGVVRIIVDSPRQVRQRIQREQSRRGLSTIIRTTPRRSSMPIAII